MKFQYLFDSKGVDFFYQIRYVVFIPFITPGEIIMYISRLLALVLSALIILIFSSPSLYANFYVVAGGGKKIGTEIKDLPYTITEPGGFYYITKDMDAPAGSNAITVAAGASDVTIDLMGFAIIGPSGSGLETGIFIGSYAHNVEIRNGTLTDFDFNGIAGAGGANGLRVINIRVCYNDSYGISVSSARGTLIKNCKVFGNYQRGIWTGPGSMVVENTCFKNTGTGIYAGSGSTVKGNTCYENLGSGVYTEYGCTIQGNTCSENNDGIYAESGSSVIGNACYSNTQYGIRLSDNSYVGGNTCYTNGNNMNSCSTCTVSADNHAP